MVSKAIVGRGKYKGFSGRDFNDNSMSDTEEKRNYVLEDSQLVFDILQHNNYEILKLMLAISNLTCVRLEMVCNDGVSTLWTKILDDVISNKLENLNSINDLHILLLQKYYSWQQHQLQNQKQKQFSASQEENEVYRILGEDVDEEDEEEDNNDDDKQQQHQKEKDEEKLIKFEGGKVIEPIRGEHLNVCVFDVASLYPKMVINYNISFDTVLCSCCKDEPLAKVPKEVTDVQDHWICKKEQGILTERMLHFTEERLKHKRLGNEIESQGLKILINAGYGVFGYENFKYFNKDVAILIAAYGRYTLTKMIELAKSQDFRVVYGDTDSLFIMKGGNQCESVSADEIESFTAKCSEALKVDVKHERTFEKVIIAKKKHYLGIFSDKSKEPVVKGLEGIKSDRVQWVRNVFAQLIEDYKNNINPVPKIKLAFSDLEQWKIKEPEKALLKTTRIGKDPQDYKNNCLQKRIGLELGLSRGDVATYYLADNDKGYTFDVNKCSILQYKKMLINAVKDILKVLGYDIEQDLLSSVSNSLSEVI